MRLSLATKIFFGFALVVCTFGAVAAYAAITLHRVGEGIREVKAYLPLTQVAATIEAFHQNRAHELQRVVDEKDPQRQRALIDNAPDDHLEELRQRLQRAHNIDIEVANIAPTEELDFLRDIDRRLSEIDTRYVIFEKKAHELHMLLRNQPRDDKAVATSAGELLALHQSLGGDIKLINVALDTRVKRVVSENSADERRGAWAILVLTAGAILLGLLVTVASLRVLAPIRKLTEMAVRIGRGDYSATAPEQGNDEIAVLAREFNAMAQSLRSRAAELAQKQLELVRAERLAAMGRVTAQITHEIRNPLSSIGLNAEMLEEAITLAKFETPEDANESVELLRAIAHEVDRLTEVTEQYLRFARASKPELQPEDVNALARALLDFLAPELNAAHITTVRELADGALWALADQGQLRQALLNLVRNAREALEPGGGVITVRTRAHAQSALIEVADDGVGIAPDDLARIFEPFFSTKQRGTGLGLSVTQQIIREHGGELTCESGIGQGTRFVITLPRGAAPEAEAVSA